MQTLGHVGRIIHGPRSSKLRVRCMRTIPWKQSTSLTLVQQNLAITSRRVEELVDDARAKSLKRICFVTGVPGAGKTLVGLNLATRRQENQPTHAVFLSGNGPLVAVLREALTRDELSRQKKRGDKVRKGEVEESVKSFIQNVHHFRDEGIIDPGPPDDHVVIFDEAQRAWNQKKAATSCCDERNGRVSQFGARVLDLIHGSTPGLGGYHLPCWWRSGDSTLAKLVSGLGSMR